jgi:glutathione S-transferase
MPVLAPHEVTTDEVKEWKGLHLFHFPYSLCSRKVRLFLREKELEWESHPIDLMKGEQHTPWYMGINPRGLVPVLVHDGKVIIESNDIMVYLDENFEGKTKMMPQTAEEIKTTNDLLHLEDSVHMDVRVLTFSKMPRERVEKSMQAKIPKLTASETSKTVGGKSEAEIGGQSKQEQIDFAKRVLEHGFSEEDKEKALASILTIMTTAQETLGDKEYMLGDRITLLDVAYFVTMSRVHAKTQHDWSASHPTLHKLYAKLLSRPSFSAESEEGLPG